MFRVIFCLFILGARSHREFSLWSNSHWHFQEDEMLTLARLADCFHSSSSSFTKCPGPTKCITQVFQQRNPLTSLQCLHVVFVNIYSEKLLSCMPWMSDMVCASKILPEILEAQQTYERECSSLTIYVSNNFPWNVQLCEQFQHFKLWYSCFSIFVQVRDGSEVITIFMAVASSLAVLRILRIYVRGIKPWA